MNDADRFRDTGKNDAHQHRGNYDAKRARAKQRRRESDEEIMRRISEKIENPSRHRDMPED